MRSFRSIYARLAGMMTRHDGDAELREEMQAHLEMETAENVRRGMSPAEARRRAMIAAGGLAQAAEAVREQRGIPWIESVGADVKYAFRALRHSRAFTAVVVITLALGIGANTAIFSVVRGVLLKPLPHRDGDRLVYLRHSVDGPGGANILFSVPEVRDYREGAPSLGGIAEYSPWTMTLRAADAATRVQVGLVTGNFFEVMGLSPVLGRVTRSSDDGSSVPAVMVLTHDYWMKQFGGDSGIVGRSLLFDNRPVTVIGVLQSAPYFPDRVSAFSNMVVSPHHISASMVQGRTHRMTEMIARLAPGATLDQARLQIETVQSRVHAAYGETYDAASHDRVALVPFKEALGERARTTLWLLMGAAAFVMLISTANVVNLTLMRSVRREHELVVRAALGAGVARLRRLLLVENLALTLMGSAAGVLLAFAGLGVLVSFADRFSARANEIQLDGVALSFTLGLSVAVAMILSFAALLPKEGTLASLISAGMRRLSNSVSKQRVQRGLVVAQIAVSVVLLAGAGLLTRTMIQLSDVDTGLGTENVLTMEISLLTPSELVAGSPAAVMAADAAAKLKYERMRQDILALPGVTEVGIGSTMPLRSTSVRFEVVAENKPLSPKEARPQAEYRTAGPEFFRAAAIPLVRGREFTAGDRFGSANVVIVNQALADKFFPNEDPIGKRVAWTGEILKFTPISREWRTIVGVVGTTRDGGLDAKPRLALFSPFAQTLAMGGGIVVRSKGDVSGVTTAATRIVRRIAPTTPIENVLTVAQIKDQSVAPRRLNALLISSFGILAVIIAAVGIAGVLAFSVSARTNEIGIRMSLGADRGRVHRMILGEGVVLLGSGLTLGVIGAWFASGVMRGLLFGVAPHDPTTFVAVAGTMAVIGLAACWIPALRASRVDPAITMRS